MLACGKRVWARDNIPILSYLLLRGRCRHCGARFSSRYALVEAVAAALAALIFWTFVVDAPGEPLGIRAARFATYFTFAAVLLCCRSSISTPSACLTSSRCRPSRSFFWPGSRSTTSPGQNAPSGAALAISWSASSPTATTTPPAARVWAWRRQALGYHGRPVRLESHSRHRVAGVARGHPGERAGAVLRRRREPRWVSVPPSPAEPASIRKAEVPFGPFLAASALAYLFLGKLAWAALMRMLTASSLAPSQNATKGPAWPVVTSPSMGVNTFLQRRRQAQSK